MLEQRITEPDELTEDNLEVFLEEQTFVDYFNTFLALPCFAERLFYNTEFAQFEEFIEKLADDIGKADAHGSSQLRKLTHFKGTIYSATNNQSRIGYYVMVLDKVQSFEFVKKHRLPLFLRSELYAEYKLTMILSTVQATFLGNFGVDEEVRTTNKTISNRNRSAVSFNLSSFDPDDISSFGERNTADSPHIRTIDDTFSAWNDSFKSADSRGSLYSYAGASSYSRTPDVIIDNKFDLDSASACENIESGQRPSSRISFLSDTSDISADSATSLQAGSFKSIESEESIHFAEETNNKSERSSTVVEENLTGIRDGKNEEEFKTKKDVASINKASSLVSVCDEPKDLNPVADLFGDEEFKPRTSEQCKTNNNHFDMFNVNKEKVHEPDQPNNSSLNNDIEKNEVSVFHSDEEDLRESVDFGCTKDNDETSSTEKIHDSLEKEKQNKLDVKDSGSGAMDKEEKRPDRRNERLVEQFELSSSETTAQFNEIQVKFGCSSIRVESAKLEKGMASVKSSRSSSVCSGESAKHAIAEDSTRELSEEFQEFPRDFLVESHSKISESEVSSELSEPIIGSRKAEDISIVDERESISKAKDSVQKNSVDTNSIEKERFVDNLGERVGNIASGDLANREITAGEEKERKENEEGQSVNLVDLSKEGSEEYMDAEDPNIDMETSSEYTLKGIRGIINGKRRVSIAATSIGFDLDDLDSSDEEDEEDLFEEQRPYDLSTKEGMDQFKEFLLGTTGEKVLRFWIEVECARFLEDDKQTESITRTIVEKYWKTGSLYELSRDIKRSLGLDDSSKVTYMSIMEQHYRILKPIMNYWCPRFTMHQQNRSDSQDLDYSRLLSERPKSLVRRENESTSLSLEPDACGMSQVTYNKQLVRPRSCRAQGQGEVSRPITAKQKLRAKSAHPRLIPSNTPVNTNASSLQLQNVTAPFQGGYGFKQNQPLSFQGPYQPDYASSVRLYINPVPTPGGKVTKMLGRLHRTTISTDQPKPTQNFKQENKPDDEIDSLIEGLILEKQTGGYFEKALRNNGNKLWIDCLSFWKSLQEFNALFFADSLNPSTLSRKAMLMYAKYVVASGAQCIGVSREIETQVFKQVDPPFEELFDAVEDHALRCLLEPWKQIKEEEKSIYSKIPLEQTLRHIEIKFTEKRRHSSIIQSNELGGIDDDIEKEKITIEEANRPMPVPKDGFSFDSLIRNRKEVEHFREFLSKKHHKGIKDLVAWTDMETFRRIPRFMNEKRDQKAKDVKNAWLTKKYFFGADSPATREGQNLIMSINGSRVIKERPTTPVISESQKFVRARIERRWLMLFKQTAEFMERQKPRTSAPEVVEDIMLKRRLQRSEAAWKILNSRWVSSSRDVVALRTCLLNSKTCAEFKTFVALKGDTFENDVDFWLEVQKFKDLCHAHAQESFIRRKVQAITECYLNSAIAPELQIDIPIEMAEKLLEKLTGRITVHPYIFREAQMTVFRMLFNHWKEFISYRSKLPPEETLLNHLQEKLNAQRAENKAKREASERRRLARLSAERKKKEKEEREKRRMEDLASLFSIDTASVFYSEVEDEMNSWYYSKYVVEKERQEHIKRLREQGLEIPPELLEEKEETKSRRSRVSSIKMADNKSNKDKKRHSMSVHGGTSSDKDESDKEGSKGLQVKLLQNLKKQYAGQISASMLSGRRESNLSVMLSLTRRNSNLSRRSDKLSSKDDKIITEAKETEKKDEAQDTKEEDPKTEKQDGAKGKLSNKAKKGAQEKPKVVEDEIQVIPDESTNSYHDDEYKKKINQGKLLGARVQRNKRLLQPSGKASRVKTGVPLDAISCISDYSVISNIDYQQVKNGKVRDRSGAATPLTFKSLKDFTNSPEGAPLAVPLPLVRITSASHKDGSEDNESQGDLANKSRDILATRKPRISSARRRLEAKKRESVIPDVIVN